MISDAIKAAIDKLIPSWARQLSRYWRLIALGAGVFVILGVLAYLKTLLGWGGVFALVWVATAVGAYWLGREKVGLEIITEHLPVGSPDAQPSVSAARPRKRSKSLLGRSLKDLLGKK